MSGSHVVLSILQPCLAPGCGRMYRPDLARRGGACSGRCGEVLRERQGLKDGEVIMHPSWRKK